MDVSKWRFGLPVLLALMTFALYWLTLSPTVLDGDSGEFQHMAYYLGVPHATGYPLYMLLTHLFTLIPFGDVAFRVNLFSAVCAALTTPLVYGIAFRLIHRRLPAIFAALFLAITPSVWGAAVQAEVYSMHLFLGGLAIFFAVRWQQDNRPRDFYALALTCGFGLTHHLLFAFTAPAFLVLVWLNRAHLIVRW